MPQTDETREKLLEATLELISEKGYLGATTREISALAGVSELTLFRKFGKKEHLFEEMLENYTFLPRLRDLLDEIGEMHVEEGLKTIGVRFLQTLQQRRPLVRILLSEISHYPEIMRSAYSQVIENIGRMLESYLESCRNRGELRPIDMNLPAFSFQRVLFATFLNESIILGKKIEDERMEFMVGEIVEIFLNGIARREGVQGNEKSGN
jgi:AcrR family transcriptional regulator